MDGATGEAQLFLPQQSESEVRSDGRNWLGQADAATRWGFTLGAAAADAERGARAAARQRRPADALAAAVGARRGRRLARQQGRRASRGATTTRSGRSPRRTPGASRRIRSRYPYYELRDVTPHVDALRVIKSPREIEILKANGRISAEAISTRDRGYAAGAIRVRAGGRGDLSPLPERRAGQRLPRHRRHRAEREHLALPGQRPADGGRRPRGDGLRRVARLPGDRHHAHVARLGPLRRSAAARVPVRARDAEGHHRRDAPGRDARADARDQPDHLQEMGLRAISAPRRPDTSSA